MNDTTGIILLVAGVLYAGHLVKNVNNKQCDARVEIQRLRSEASMAAASAGVTLPQCESHVISMAGMRI